MGNHISLSSPIRLLSPEEFTTLYTEVFEERQSNNNNDKNGNDDSPNSYLPATTQRKFQSQKLIQHLPNLGTTEIAFLQDGSVAGSLTLSSCSTLFSFLLQGKDEEEQEQEKLNTKIIQIPLFGKFFINQDENYDVEVLVLSGLVNDHQKQTKPPLISYQQKLYWNKYDGKLHPSYQQRTGDDEDEERTFKIEMLDSEKNNNNDSEETEQAQEQEPCSFDAILFLPQEYRDGFLLHQDTTEKDNSLLESSQNTIETLKKNNHSKTNNNNKTTITPSQAAMIIALDALVTELGVPADMSSIFDNGDQQQQQSPSPTLSGGGKIIDRSHPRVGGGGSNSLSSTTNTQRQAPTITLSAPSAAGSPTRKMLLDSITEENELRNSPINFLRNLKKGRNIVATTPQPLSSSSSPTPTTLSRQQSSTSRQLVAAAADEQNRNNSSDDESDDDDVVAAVLTSGNNDESTNNRKRNQRRKRAKNEDAHRPFSIQARNRYQNHQKSRLFTRLGNTFHVPNDETSLRKLFDSFDIDNTKFIDREEFIACYMEFESEMGLDCLTRKDVDEIFHKIDKNHDSKLSFKEFQSFLLHRAKE